MGARLFIALILFVVARVLFFLFNTQYFSSYSFFNIAQAFLYGLRFDLSALAYANIGFILFTLINLFTQRKYIDIVGRVFYVLGNSISFFLNIADAQYFPFSRSRTSAGIFSQWTDVKNLMGQYVLTYWYVLLIFIMVVIML